MSDDSPAGTELRFPKDFLFGVATSSYQVEGGIENDWSEWERQGKLHDANTRCGRACDHWERFYDDIPRIVATGSRAYRMSIEWARVEPERGRWDDAAWEGYRSRVQALSQAGIRPIITLHHFTHPTWFHEATPWHEKSSLVAWRRYVTRCAEMLCGIDVGIVTINEPMVFWLAGYITGFFPPGLKDARRGFWALAHLAEAHVIARDAFSSRTPRVDCGIAQNVLAFAPARRWHPIDRALTRLANSNYNHAFLEALTTGRLRIQMPGLVSGSATIDGAERAMDYVGVNYYTRAHLKFQRRSPFLAFEYIDRHQRDLTDIGWEYYPEGLGQMLRQMKQYGRPIWITENGLDDRLGVRRSQFLFEHWQQVLSAISAGINVTTYLHWSLFDNFEWLEGFGPRFGLYHVDFDTTARTPTAALAYFRQVAESGVLQKP